MVLRQVRTRVQLERRQSNPVLRHEHEAHDKHQQQQRTFWEEEKTEAAEPKPHKKPGLDKLAGKGSLQRGGLRGGERR